MQESWGAAFYCLEMRHFGSTHLCAMPKLDAINDSNLRGIECIRTGIAASFSIDPLMLLRSVIITMPGSVNNSFSS
jgi:hypothetical protein